MVTPNGKTEYTADYLRPVPKSTYTEKEYPLVTGADVYVAPDGDDSAPGSFERPVRTFARAAELVREIKKSAEKEIVVAFKAGEYGRLNLTLTKEDSGTESVPVTYCRYGDGDVIFNNGFTIKKEDFLPLCESEKDLFSEDAAEDIYKFSLDGYFVSGLPEGITPYEGRKACNLSRFPDKKNSIDIYCEDSIDPVGKDMHFPGMALSRDLKKELDKCTDTEDMIIRGYIVRGYRVDSFHVTGYDSASGILSIDPEKDVHPEYHIFGVRTPGLELDRVYVENNPKFLTSEGEFWCDRKTNTLYVFSPQDDWNIGVYGNFLTLDHASFVTLKGLTFKNCFNENAIAVKDSSHVTLSLVNVEGVTGLTVAAAEQSNDLPGTNTVLSVTGESDFLTVSECEFSCFKHHGIDLYPNRDAVNLNENHMVVDNNFFHDCGNGNTFENNVIVDRSVGALLSHNHFKDSESGAFDLGTLSTIEYNVMENMMTSTHDYGTIYAQLCMGVLARGNVIRYNIFDRLVDNGENYCIYLDDSTSDMKVYGNIFCGSVPAVVIHNSRSHEVHDNVFINGCAIISGLITCDGEGKLLDDIRPDGNGGPHWEWNGLYRLCMKDRPGEGEPGYERWKEKFPDLYTYYVDTENLTGKENLACPYNEIYDNIDIAAPYRLSEDRRDRFPEYAEKVGKIYGNVQFSYNENPCFADPSKGDYTIREDADFFKIPYDKIGRY